MINYQFQSKPPMLPSRTDQLLNRLRMRQIALMLAIDKFRTLRVAAMHLGVTQPAASNMLRELEDALGETLFDRVGRRLELNPAGEAVLNTFRGIRNSVASMERELHALRLGASGKLLIGSTPAVVTTNLSAAMIALKEDYPLLSVELNVDTSDRLIELLRDGKLDVVIGRMPESSSPGNQDCLFTPIGEEALSVIAAFDHPLAQIPKKRLEFRALLDYPWIFQLRGSPTRELVEQEFQNHHAVLPPGLIETSSFLTIIDLVTHSQMIAVIPRSVANQFARNNLLRILPYTFDRLLTSWGYLVYRGRHINPVMRRFLDLIRNASDR